MVYKCAFIFMNILIWETIFTFIDTIPWIKIHLVKETFPDTT